MLDTLKEALALVRDGRTAVMATVVNLKGSTPRKLGARMLILDDGSIRGSIGGGALEHYVMNEAAAVLASGKPRVLELDLAEDLSMGCGGSAWVLMEPLTSPPRLVIFGGGHIAVHLCDMAARCGFSVWVLDGRPGFAEKSRFPSAARLVPKLDPETVLEDASLEGLSLEHTFAVVVTHGHELDTAIMERLAPLADLAYLGMIGSRKKAALLFRHLSEKGAEPGLVRRIRAPIGLPTGGQNPGEIAVSILAELQAARHKTPLDSKTLPSEPETS